MTKVLTPHIEAGSKKSNEPRLIGSIVEEMLHDNSPLAKSYCQYIASRENEEAEEPEWHRNTDLAVDLKTVLRSDHSMKTDKEYLGVLRRDSDAEIEDFRCQDAHYTFTELVFTSSVVRRNVCIYEGKHITCTKRLNGMVRLNFKSLKQDVYSDIYRFAIEVAKEIREALNGLIEEE